MVPLPIDNELDHTEYAHRFVEKYALRYLNGSFPESRDFLTLDLTTRTRTGYCLPDFAVISVNRSTRRHPRKELFGFELKVPAGVSLQAVEQACRQKETADAVYLIFLLPDSVPQEKSLDRIRKEARSHGIGIIRVKDWLKSDEHEILEIAATSQPKNLNAMAVVEGFLRNSERHLLRSWLSH